MFICSLRPKAIVKRLLFLAVIAILPTIAMTQLGQTSTFGATSVLIMVSVALETTDQLESHMLMRHYKGFLN